LSAHARVSPEDLQGLFLLLIWLFVIFCIRFFVIVRTCIQFKIAVDWCIVEGAAALGCGVGAVVARATTASVVLTSSQFFSS
jgi:hypothetical protein